LTSDQVATWIVEVREKEKEREREREREREKLRLPQLMSRRPFQTLSV
jgi:hypothetical protein